MHATNGGLENVRQIDIQAGNFGSDSVSGSKAKFSACAISKHINF